MFDEWRKRRDLRKRIAALEEEKEQQALTHAQGTDKNSLEQQPFFFSQGYELSTLQRQLADLETDQIIRKARKLGVEIPHKESWWVEDETVEPKILFDGTYEGKFYLTEFGKEGISRLIREERRKAIEWWVTVIIVPILSTLIGFLGLLVALVAIYQK